ncbi:hypothetical protein KY362_00750 [Candidatus Woesearchaeota archaeon]|nr:hypothetical protein [Candidatus Woesearchaeota archaeon]
MKEFKGKMDQHKQQSDRCFYALALEFKNTDSHFRKHMMKYHKEKYGY